TVFAQRRNLLNPGFLRMLSDIIRFNRQATAIAALTQDADIHLSLGRFLEKHQYSAEFRNWYLLPMAACIWSCPADDMLEFPLSSFVRFCHNHGLLQVNNRPQWRTVKGGARKYVDEMLLQITQTHLRTPVQSVRASSRNTVLLQASGAEQEFDHVVLASHSDQNLKLLADATADERAVLSGITYQPNRAVLHTDARFLPQNKKAWSAWNYQSGSSADPRVCVHYLINQLQPLPFTTPVIVSLNPIEEPDRNKLIAEYDYAHPFFDQAAIAAQALLPAIQGKRNIWFAGAWTGYGFHEDGLKSGLLAAEGIAQSAQRQQQARAA
ncbi:NAD(P)/FAD-dependent oxidoreductase, partial [Undibacterium sp.]|uniref:NAD(P)/FAD-dependent oxidoreductase n=1 Tax=Undibacterium sp. TaxID=1914977 RepID=UPI00374CD75A